MQSATSEGARWIDAVDHDLLGQLATEALAHRTSPDSYLEMLVHTAWDATLRLAAPGGSPRLVLTPDGYLEASALSALANGTVEVNRAFLRRAAFESVCAAEERTLGYCEQASYGAVPAWITSPQEWPERVLDLDVIERTHVTTDGFAHDWVDAGVLVAHAVARGEKVPNVGARGRGLAALGLVVGRIRRDDPGLLNDPGWAPHILRLHHHTILNLLCFALAHELGHLALGHLAGPRGGADAARRFEVDADQHALRAVTGFGDVPAALAALGQLHDSERSSTRRSSLTHPYSSERLLLLAYAVRTAEADHAVLDRVSTVLRGLETSCGTAEFFATDGPGTLRVPVSTSSDLRCAYLRATLVDGREEPSADSLVGVDFVYRRIVDRSVLASSSALLHLAQPVLTTSRRDPATGKVTHLFLARFRVPPAWRARWPDGVLEVDRVVEKADAVARTGRTASQILTELLRQRQSTQWVEDEEDLLGPNLADSADDVLDRMDWCLFLRRPDEARELGVRAVRNWPARAGYELTCEVLQELIRCGRFAEVLELGLGYCDTLQVLRPTIHLEIGRAAEELGDLLLAYDQYFVDLHAFNAAREPAEVAAHPSIVLLDKHREDPVVRTLLRFHAEYGASRRRALTRWGRKRKYWRLMLCLALLRQLPPAAQDRLFVLQSQAEVLADLFVGGRDESAGEEAARLWDLLLAKYPWWSPGWVQASYLADDRGDRQRALACFRRAEQISPQSVQVDQARSRYFPASTRDETARGRLDAVGEWIEAETRRPNGRHLGNE
jgi:hypothetical protein